jgi:hypothetical protein
VTSSAVRAGATAASTAKNSKNSTAPPVRGEQYGL